MENGRVPIIRNSSLSRLDDGGAAIFIAQFINHHMVRVGNAVISPLVRKILRVWVDSYVMFARANSLDEHSPWASIMVSAAFHPHEEFDRRPAMRSLIWPIDEYAIRDFRSV